MPKTVINIPPPIAFCPQAETIDAYASRIELYGIINNLSHEQQQKLFNDGLPEDFVYQSITASNHSMIGNKRDGSNSSKTKKPRKISDFVHSIFIMLAFISVLILFIRHFSIEASENHNNNNHDGVIVDE